MNKLMQNILIIHNPNSGKGRGDVWANRLLRRLGKVGASQVTVYGSPTVESFHDFCSEHKNNPMGYTLVVVIGGDGTLSVCVDAMLRNDFVVPIYAFGRGTANDFQAFMKTNRSVKRAVNIMMRGKTQDIDLLEVNGKQIAVNVAGGGVFTNGVTKYTRRSKKLLGRLAYTVGGAKELFRMKGQNVRITVDGKTTEMKVFLFLVMNCTNAGSLRGLSPTSSPWDGLLEVIAVQASGAFGVIGTLAKVLFRRSHRARRVTTMRGREISVELLGETTRNFTVTDIDGNRGDAFPLCVKLSEKKVEVISGI